MRLCHAAALWRALERGCILACLSFIRRGNALAHICWVIRDLRGGGPYRVVVHAVNGLCERGHRVDLVLFFAANDYLGAISDRASVFLLSRRPGRWERLRRRAANLLRKKPKRYRNIEVPGHSEWFARRLPLARLPGLAFRLVREHRWPLRDLTRRPKRADFIRALRLGRYLEEQKPEIVFTNLLSANLAGFLASRTVPDCPAIVPVAHNIVRRQRTEHFDLLRRVFPASPHVVAVSRGAARNFVETVGVSPDRITTIYNPVVTPELARRAEEPADHPWFGDGGPPVLLGAGRLAPEKDFATLIEAFRRVAAERPCRLVILGEGRLRRELESQVRALGLEAHVSLPGWAENPFAFMARAALFVLSSRHEGFGNVLVEALACGCPAVSTDCPAGPAEILEDPVLLAPVGDPEALAHTMLRALAAPVDKTALRAKAARFSAESAAIGYEGVTARCSVGSSKDENA